MNKTIEVFSKIKGLKLLGGCSEEELQAAENHMPLVMRTEHGSSERAALNH